MRQRNAISKLYASIILAVLIIAAVSSLYVASSNQTRSRESYPITIVDDLGRNLTLSKVPQRIVSLVPSNTEIVFAVGAGDRVVGVTRYDISPPDLVQRVKAGSILIVGGGYDPDIEKIVALKPDIILVGSTAEVSSQSYNKLQGLGFTLVALNANSIDGVLKDITLVGKIVGNDTQAQQVVTGIKGKVDSVVSLSSNAAKVKVYIENWPNPIFSVGTGSLQNDMVKKCGGTNVFSDLNGSKQVSAEAVIARNPDVMIMFHNQTNIDELKTRPGWENISAIKNNKVFQMTGYEAAPNPLIADSLQKMCNFIHPELFSTRQSVGLIQNFTLLAPLAFVVALEKEIEG